MIYATPNTPSTVTPHGVVTFSPTPEHPVTVGHDTFTHGEVVCTYHAYTGSWSVQYPDTPEEQHGVIAGDMTPPTLLRALGDTVIFPEDLGKIEGPVDSYITDPGNRAWYTSQSRFAGFDAGKIFVDLRTQPGPIIAKGRIFHGEVAIVFNGNTLSPRWAVTNSVHEPVTIEETTVPHRIRQMIDRAIRRA